PSPTQLPANPTPISIAPAAAPLPASPAPTPMPLVAAQSSAPAPLTVAPPGQPMPLGSPTVPVSPAFAEGRVRTIQEAGKPPLKAKIVVSWRTPDGMQAAQCEALETGEKITLV